MFRDGIKIDNEVLAQNKPGTYSHKPLGSFVENGATHFSLFAPNAVQVNLYTFEKVDGAPSGKFQMECDEAGVWEFSIDNDLSGKFYGYKVLHRYDEVDIESKPLCIDPYAKAMATFTSHYNPRKSIVYNKDFDWDGDSWITLDWRDLIIYEMHIRDITAHPSSRVDEPGTYRGLMEKGKTGGISYIKKLGVNTVELLPAMEYGYCEIPYEDSLKGRYNTWNPYERNHWGYMTADYFAPASYYSQPWENFNWNRWIGEDARQVNDFKNMVKNFHKEGIAVMMDVVYNHLSEYEIGNLKEIDKEYYFRLDDKGDFISESYCGNDLKTEAPMMRRLILDSILYWMQEYHIDGFRFDLGKLIDWGTIEAIIREARKLNPDVVFVCEPWGGGYDPTGFSERGWGAWNDQIRNGIKGENPKTGLGWRFGKWYGNNSPARIKSYINGTLLRDKFGLFKSKEHSVNYLESHDGYTLGDFIRIGTKKVRADKPIVDKEEAIRLNSSELALNKLAALFLLTSQGIAMISSGQEFARSKIIPYNPAIEDVHEGMLDHNSYNKDNETNYINYEHAKWNSELLEYYRGLIKLRKTYRAFRQAEYSGVKFFHQSKNKFALGYNLKFDEDEFIVLLNSNQKITEIFDLPNGDWKVLVNSEKSGITPLKTVIGNVEVPAVSGMVLKRN